MEKKRLLRVRQKKWIRVRSVGTTFLCLLNLKKEIR